MKRRAVLALVAVVAGVMAAWLWPRQRQAQTPAPAVAAQTVASAVTLATAGSVAATSAPTVAATKAPARANAEVAIQDGKTLDFSSGKAVVKDDDTQKKRIDQAVADMDAAAAGVTFTRATADAGKKP